MRMRMRMRMRKKRAMQARDKKLTGDICIYVYILYII